MMDSIPSSRSLIKMLNRTGPITDPWGTPLVTSRQLDAALFTSTLWAWPSSQFLTQHRLYRNIIDLFQEEEGHLTNRDRLKAEVFNALFASVFNTDNGPRGSKCHEQEYHDCKNYQLPFDPEIVRDLLLQLDPYESVLSCARGGLG
ncbi:hypothetical protein BTVI_00320 [Pitangus sulphuratus]|nr:hypothetical protein BTVI_00320 [Pitangus sulphuratus]